MEINQPKSIKLTMRECKLRSDVNWWGILHSLGTMCFIYASHFHMGYPDTPWFHQGVVAPVGLIRLIYLSRHRANNVLWENKGLSYNIPPGTKQVAHSDVCALQRKIDRVIAELESWFNPYPTAFPYGNGMVLHFYQQQESSTTKTVHKVINKRLKTYV